jgi:methyl-accepting chemotaxis protein
MSGKAAREIAEIVKESIKSTEVITVENKKRVEVGNTYVLETGKNLKEIMASAGTVSIGAKQVLDASKDQSRGIEQINKAMGQIDKATQDNAATAEEAASSSEELNAQTEVLNSVVEDLVKLVNGSNGAQSNIKIQSKQISSVQISRRYGKEQKKNEFKTMARNNGGHKVALSVMKKSDSKNLGPLSQVESESGDGWDSI